LALVHGQVCRATFNASITGECAFADECNGTLLTKNRCEFGACCINGDPIPTHSSCLNQTVFKSIYNTTRGAYLVDVLNYGINQAGICSNCRAQAAFLAIAATMTDDFTKDEATGTNAQFARDDQRYGNTVNGDGSKYRRRGLFGLRGKTMYERLQKLMPRYQLQSAPESVAKMPDSAWIAAQLWKDPTLDGGLLFDID
jgi:predicted chitinase